MTTTMLSSAAVFPRQHYGRALGLYSPSSPPPPPSSPSFPHPHPPNHRRHHHHHLGRDTKSTSPVLFAVHHQTWGTALSVVPCCTPGICGPSCGVRHGGAAATIWGPPQPLLQRRRRVAAAAAAAGQGKQPSSSKKEDKLVTEGLITELLPNCMFRVRLENGDVILGYVSGKMRTKMVRVLVGDRVKIEVSRYDSTRGRIIYRLRSTKSSSTPDQ